MKNKIRLSFDLPSETKSLLEDLQRRSNATSLTEVFRKAITVYEIFLEQKENKGKVVLEGPDGEREVLRLI